MVQAVKEVKIDLENGSYLSCSMRAGQGEGLVFLHGFPDCKEVWNPVIAMLPDSKPFLAIDLPSFGCSSIVDDSMMSLSEISASLMSAISKAGFAKVRLVCHDWGGFLGWLLLDSKPDMFTGMIAANAPHPYGYYTVLGKTPLQQQIFNYVKFFCKGDAADFLSQNSLEILKKHRTYNEGYGFFHSEAGFESTWGNRERLHAALGIYRQNVSRISRGEVPAVRTSLPVSMLWGRNDHSLVIEQCEVIRDFTDGPFAVDFTNGGHWAFLDEPKRLSDLIMKQCETHP